MKYLAAVALLLAAANASPTDMVPRNVTPAELTKRDTEIIYLANQRADNYNGPEYQAKIFYYGASNDANAGKAPSASNECVVSLQPPIWSHTGSFSCTFPTGVTFNVNIESYAQSLADYSYVGWGSNGYKNWNCYKDNGHLLFEQYGYYASSSFSVYYCLPQ